MVKLTVYWATRNAEANAKIRQRFGIPAGMTLNGETVAEIREEDMPLLEETARRGFIQIRYKPDTRKGGCSTTSRPTTSSRWQAGAGADPHTTTKKQPKNNET